MNMFRLALSVSVLVGLSLGAVAEQNHDHSVQAVQGCLSYTNNTYVITGGDSQRQYRIIQGDTSELRGKQGHTVTVTGVVGQNEPRENTTEPPNEGTTTGVTYNTIMVRSVKDIAPNCSYPGFSH